MHQSAADRVLYSVRLPAERLSRIPQQLPLHKRAVLDQVGTPWRHDVDVSQHAALSLRSTPTTTARAPALVIVTTPFAYEPAPDVMTWHVNFADPELFCAYDSPLLAQDELQALEHPCLGSVREALIDDELSTRTVTNDVATPILLRGVERHIAFNTAPGPHAPAGLYGNRFARASVDAIVAATTVIAPPTLTNLIAMASLPGGRGAYTLEQLTFLFTTAYTAFSAARSYADAKPTVICTGYWGCGAFGGNRVVMATVQLLAADAADIHTLRFFTFDDDGRGHIERAQTLYAELMATGDHIEQRLMALAERGLLWGESDGN